MSKIKTEAGVLIDKHPQLSHSENKKVASHVQRESGEWSLNTLMLEGYEVPFQFKRKKKYKNLSGARVNLSYYPEITKIGGIDFEIMKVVRIRVA